MVRVTLYGNLAEAIGREIELQIPSGSTVGAARRALAERFPQVTELRGRSVRGSVDDTIVNDETVVPDGAELAFFPPLSGG